MIALVKPVFLSLICLLLLAASPAAAKTIDVKHVEVAMRMIGHQVLLKAHDSSSKVLPVLNEENTYVIQFESEFSFNPDDLKHIVDSVLLAAHISSAYILEVKTCESGEIIYSYEVSDYGKSDIVPCRSRDQPSSCYSIVISLLSLESTHERSMPVYIAIALIILLVSLWITFRKHRGKSRRLGMHLIKLGKYQFDQRNSMLILKEQRTELTSKEAELLLLLHHSMNTTVEREDILNKVWGDDGDYIGRTLDVFISKLRKKLEADPDIRIVNVRGVGYKLVLDE